MIEEIPESYHEKGDDVEEDDGESRSSESEEDTTLDTPPLHDQSLPELSCLSGGFLELPDDYRVWFVDNSGEMMTLSSV